MQREINWNVETELSAESAAIEVATTRKTSKVLANDVEDVTRAVVAAAAAAPDVVAAVVVVVIILRHEKIYMNCASWRDLLYHWRE